VRLPPFKLERYFAQWEFKGPSLLCSSDVEPWRLPELLALADEDGRRRWETLSLGYTESLGLPALREEISTLYSAVAPDEVLVFAGAEEAVFVLLNVLLGAGDHALVTWPAYQSLYEVARGAGAEVTLLELREETGWALDLPALEDALRPNTRLVVVNFLHNPTGSLPGGRTFRALCSLCEARGIYLFSDEVYRLLEYAEADRLPAAVDLGRRCISLGVMSKAFGLAGLRIGWLACRDRALFDRIAAFKDYTTICSAAPAEVLALIALRARDRVLERSRRIVLENLARVDDFFARQRDRFASVRPRAGPVAFPRLLGDEPVARFAQRLLEKEGVLLLPGEAYDYGGNHFRLGFGRTNLPEALSRLERFR
jgi:aspartate/methionine/tyrosine aminotransferase